jgi:hypothetical protein
MARDGKRKGGGGKAAGTPKGGATAAVDGRTPKLDTKVARLVAKRVKKLEQQLAEANRLERKRLRALDRAHRRRQLIEAALDELRTDPGSGVAAVDDAASTAPAEPGPGAPIATAAAAPTTAARKTPTARTRANPAPAAATRATGGATTSRPAAPKASPRRTRKPAGPEA